MIILIEINGPTLAQNHEEINKNDMK